MKLSFILSIAALAAVATPSAGAAQTLASTQVTVNVPVNLTQLGPGVSKVQVACIIQSPAITNGTWGGRTDTVRQAQEYPVSGGAVQTQASLVFSLTGLNDPTGKNATVQCSLTGWDQKAASWEQFTANHPDPNFRTNTTVSFELTQFVW